MSVGSYKPVYFGSDLDPTADLPTHLELPCTDGQPVDDALQPRQRGLLTSSLLPVLEKLHPDGQFFVAEDVGVYWRRTIPVLEGCTAPDWFYVPNVSPMRDGIPRRSYTMWDEVVSPLLAVEVVSRDGREEHDRTPGTGRFWAYEQGLRCNYLIIHAPRPEGMEVYELRGKSYRLLDRNGAGRVLIPELGVEFGVWHGAYQEYTQHWLRVWDAEGELLPTAEEREAREFQRAEQEKQRANLERRRANQERQRANEEKQRANQEKQRADKMAEKLRELGIDLESI